MQENGKKMLSFLLVVAMVVSMLPMRVFAQEQETLPQAMPEEIQQEEETILPVVTEPELQTEPQTKDQPGMQPGMSGEGETALERIEASPITIMEGTNGYVSMCWDEKSTSK